MDKKGFGVIAFVAIVIGVLLILPTVGISYKLPGMASSPTVIGEDVSVAVSTNVRSYSHPLSSIAKGYEYKWSMTGSNTGSVAWSDSWVTIRLGVNGASVVDKTEGGVGGAFKVEQCSYGTDVQACREDIRDGWMLQMNDGSGWSLPPGNCLDAGTYQKVCRIDFGTLAPGQSKTVEFKLVTPTSAAEGNYPLITNLMAGVSGTYAVANQVDSLSLGTISGDLTLALIGLLSVIGGGALLGTKVFGV